LTVGERTKKKKNEVGSRKVKRLIPKKNNEEAADNRAQQLTAALQICDV